MKISLIKTTDRFSETSIYSAQRYNQGNFHHHGEHLGLGYVGAVLKEEGHEVNLIYQLENLNDFTRRIYDSKPDVVMATSLTGAFNITKTIFRGLKDLDPKIITIIGGDHISGHPQSIDDVAIDFGIIGEGEYISRKLIKALETGEDKRTINGLVYKDSNHGVVINLSAKPIKNLDDLPFPLRTLESISQTSSNAIFNPSSSKALPRGIFYTSRGCPYKCNECSSQNTLGGVRYRTIDKVIDEIQEIKNKFGIKAMAFYDLTFNANRDHVQKLCNGLINARVGLNWYAIARLTSPTGKSMLDKDILELMHEAGCRKISFGIESFDKDVLSYYGKKADPEQVRNILELVDQVGMINRAFLMLGNKDSPKSIQRTLEGIVQCPIHELRITLATPFPGTQFYKECKNNNSLITGDWTRYTGDYSILKPEHFDKPTDLIIERKKLFKTFMNSLEYQERMREKVRRNPEFEEGVNEYFGFLKSNGILS